MWYEPTHIKITPGTAINSPSNDWPLPGANDINPDHVYQSAGSLFGMKNDSSWLETIEVHCEGPFGPTDLRWIKPSGVVDGFVLVGGTVVDTSISFPTVQVNQIPIPGAAILLGSGLLGLVGLRRRWTN